MPKKAIVVGAGIVGLAATRALALRGYSVTVFEREQQAVGASIRNFGMVWPVGQPVGKLYERALRSRNIWVEICEAAGIWHDPCGSLQCAHREDELAVIQEFAAANDGVRSCTLLTKDEALRRSPYLNGDGFLGALYSPDEVIVDPREAIDRLPDYLTERHGVQFHFGTLANAVERSVLFAGGKRHEADEIYVCSGPDFETLYPELFAATGITKCKLQMMRTEPHDHIGPAICGGMTLTHYAAFESCASLPALKARIAAEHPEHVTYGIHVMVAQNGRSELVIGDSHEYGLTHDPFIRMRINELITDYLKSFASFPQMRLAETWHGIYPKLKGATELVLHPEPGVTVVNGLSGAGMSLSFGLLEELVTATG